MARIERGDPAVAMASYVMCLWLINPAAALSDLIAPSKDTMALEHEVTRAQARRPKRASKTPRTSPVPMTLAYDINHAGAVATLREELKHAQTPTALGLAALLSKAPGNSQ